MLNILFAVLMSSSIVVSAYLKNYYSSFVELLFLVYVVSKYF